MSELYEKFSSTGFKQLNVAHYQHQINLYKHNYKKFLPADKQAKILDIGCGLGQFLSFVAQQGYSNILGVDISQEQLDFCLEKGISKVKKIDDLVEFLQVCEVYDLIVLNDVIEHLPKQQVVKILKLIRQKLSVSGQLIIKTGNLSSMVGPKIRYNDFTHESGFTEFSLNQVLLASNFRQVLILPFVFPKNSLFRILRFIGQKIIHAGWKLIFFLEYTQVPKIVDELIFAVAKK